MRAWILTFAWSTDNKRTLWEQGPDHVTRLEPGQLLAQVLCSIQRLSQHHQSRRALLARPTPSWRTTTTLLPHRTRRPKHLPQAPFLSALLLFPPSSLPPLQLTAPSPRSLNPAQPPHPLLRHHPLSKNLSTRPLRRRLSQTPKPPSQNPKVTGSARALTTANRHRRTLRATVR